MSRKVVILLGAAGLAAAGCSATRPGDLPPSAGKTVLAPKPAPHHPGRSAARPAPSPAPPPTPAGTSPEPADAPAREDLASMIKGDARWADPDRALLLVSERHGAGADDPVPLFRQAIVIASVRSAVAGSPAEPEASFRNGQLTLSFRRGSASEVASAVNRALAVPEVTRLAVVPPAN